jgi:hypothetical protein
MGDYEGKVTLHLTPYHMFNQTNREQSWKKNWSTLGRMGEETIHGLSATRILSLQILLSYPMRFRHLPGQTESLTHYGPQLMRTMLLLTMADTVCIANPLSGSFLICIAVDVHKYPYVWKLSMSVKLDANSNVIGSYGREDLGTFWKRTEKNTRTRLREIEYELVWSITEMQVKTFVRAIFPRAIGPLTMQLAQEQALGPHELVYGESRSHGLIRDIEASAAAALAPIAQHIDNHKYHLDDLLNSSGRQLIDTLANEYEHPRAAVAQMTSLVQNIRPVAQVTNESHVPIPVPLAESLGMPGPSRPAPADGSRQGGTRVSLLYRFFDLID